MYTTPPANTHNNMKWATFTFSSPHICRITNLFKFLHQTSKLISEQSPGK